MIKNRPQHPSRCLNVEEKVASRRDCEFPGFFKKKIDSEKLWDKNENWLSKRWKTITRFKGIRAGGGSCRRPKTVLNIWTKLRKNSSFSRRAFGPSTSLPFPTSSYLMFYYFMSRKKRSEVIRFLFFIVKSHVTLGSSQEWKLTHMADKSESSDVRAHNAAASVSCRFYPNQSIETYWHFLN